MGLDFSFPAKKSEGYSLLFTLAGMIAAGVLGSAELGRRLFRDTRLFDPESEPVESWSPTDYGFAAAQTEEVTFKSDGNDLHGWYCRAERPRASILFCHGKTGNITWFAPAVKALVDAGFNVLIFDYRGFGRSGGRPSVRGVVRDAVAAASLHVTMKPVDLPSILWGYSMGGAIGAEAFLRCSFDGVVLQSTFTSLPEITRLHYPGTPLHLLAGTLYDTLSFVKTLNVPLLVLHGEADETVPVDMARLLHESCAGSKLLLIPGGMHRDLFEVGSASISRGLQSFVTKVRMKQLLRRSAASRTATATTSPATP